MMVNIVSLSLSRTNRYRLDYLSSSIAHLTARAHVGHGAYIDSCLVHEQNLDYCSGGNPHAYVRGGFSRLVVCRVCVCVCVFVCNQNTF